MSLDFVVLFLLIVAFAAGFQKGFFRSFTLVLSFFFATVLALIFTPYLLRFLDHSFGDTHLFLQFICTLAVFLLVIIIIYQLLLSINNWRSERINFLRLTMGGVTLVVMMLFSIGILTGFLQQSGILKKEDLAKSHCFQYIEPVQSMTSGLWEKAMLGANTIKEKSQERSRELLSKAN